MVSMHLHLIFLSLLSSSLWAAAPAKDLVDQSFARDNTFCQVGGNRIEFSVRGYSKFTEPKDKGFGELLFYRIKDSYHHIDGTEAGSRYLRFFKSEKGLCSKAASYDIDGDTFALLLLKANRPYKDKLVIQLFDSKKMTPLKTISTDYMADKSMHAPNGFTFRINSERLDIEMGSIMMDGQKFTYQDRDFQEWINFEKDSFFINEKLTFQESPYKEFFKDEADFLTSTGWSNSDRKFTKRSLYVAVNHQMKKECVLVLPAPSKLSGSEEGWRCRPK